MRLRDTSCATLGCWFASTIASGSPTAYLGALGATAAGHLAKFACGFTARCSRLEGDAVEIGEKDPFVDHDYLGTTKKSCKFTLPSTFKFSIIVNDLD